MMPMEAPWIEWQEKDMNTEDIFAWKWKENTPKEIKKQYEEWEKYYNKKMKMK